MNRQTAKQKFLPIYLRDHPENAAMTLLKLNSSELMDFFREYSNEDIFPVLSFLPPLVLAQAFEGLEGSRVVDFLNQLSPNMSASILRHWKGPSQDKEDYVDSILKEMEESIAKVTKRLLSYDDHTVGSLMNPVPFAVRENVSVKELMSLLKKQKHRYSRYIYIVDEESLLKGVLPFKDAFYSDEQATLSGLMTAQVISLKPDVTAASALKKSIWKKWDSVPVTDSKNRLIGVVRYDALEQDVVGGVLEEFDNQDLQDAGAALGEVVQLAALGTLCALGIEKRK